MQWILVAAQAIARDANMSQAVLRRRQAEGCNTGLSAQMSYCSDSWCEQSQGETPLLFVSGGAYVAVLSVKRRLPKSSLHTTRAHIVQVVDLVQV